MPVRRIDRVTEAVSVAPLATMKALATITPVVLMRERFQSADAEARNTSSAPEFRLASLMAIVRYVWNKRPAPKPRLGAARMS